MRGMIKVGMIKDGRLFVVRETRGKEHCVKEESGTT